MNYYDLNAKEFFDGTVDVDMSAHYNEFLDYQSMFVFFS